MATNRAQVVVDIEQFVDQLEDGDILLFDKLASLNRLVQWADNRPVGHCALWYDGGVYEATIRTLSNGEQQGGVFRAPLLKLLETRVTDGRGEKVGLVRTVTALRHPDMSENQRHSAVAHAADLQRRAEFAVPEMALLAPYALQRSFGGDIRPSNAVLSGLIRTCISYVKASASVRLRGSERLFCSQLVYQCYQHAGMEIEILDPLYDWYNRPRARGVGPEAEEAAQLLDQYSAIFEEEVLAGAPVGGATSAEYEGGHEPSARSWPVFAALSGAARPPRFDEMITPGDFWSSPSLDPVVAFHRPPTR